MKERVIKDNTKDNFEYTNNIMAKIKGQKDNQQSIKQHIESYRSSNTNPTKHRGSSRVLWKGKQFMLH